MNKHGSQDVDFLRQGTKVLLKPGRTSMGLAESAEATELSLIPKGSPCNLQQGGGTRHSCVGSVPWTVLRKESYSSFCAKNLPPSGSSSPPILPSHQGRSGHTGPPSSGTTLQSSSQGHGAPPGLHLFTLCPLCGSHTARPALGPAPR